MFFRDELDTIQQNTNPLQNCSYKFFKNHPTLNIFSFFQ